MADKPRVFRPKADVTQVEVWHDSKRHLITAEKTLSTTDPLLVALAEEHPLLVEERAAAKPDAKDGDAR